MTHIMELFPPSKYVAAFELKGRDVTLTIVRVVAEVIDGAQSVVWARVCGMTEMLMRAPRQSQVVRLTPSIAIEPFSTARTGRA